MTTAIRNKFMDVDPHLKNAYSPNGSMDEEFSGSQDAVKFDIGHKKGPFIKLLDTKCKQEDLADDEIALKTPRPKEWELDVRPLISSRRWLQNYGLKKNRLELAQLLPTIGFKLSDEYDTCLKKPVSSRYGGGLFRHMMHPDGRTFNVNCPKDKLLHLEKRLVQAMNLFKRRLEWLTTESRRVFGVIEERTVTIVLDIRDMSPQQFDQYRTALERVLREQVSQISKFNLIRASEDIQLYSPECVAVSHDTLETAIQWLWKLDRLAPVSNTAAAEAIFKATCDQHNEAIYLFTEGTSIDKGKEILKEKISCLKLKRPVHVVSFNCDCSNTIKYLKQFTKSTHGKFHAYAVVMELDAYEAQPGDGISRSANIMLRRKTFGGIPPGAGVRDDVVLLFEEMEETRNNLAQIRMLIEKAPEPGSASQGNGKENEPSRALLSTKNEEYMSSVEWLEIYGLEAKRLGLYDVLSSVSFKHQDGVIDIMRQPHNDNQTDAIVEQRLVNARYCERFPIVRWKDGRVVHVQVTAEVHRGYEEKVQVALNKIQQRIDWLNKGSRALFGTVVEEQIYILVDMSASMQPSIGFVKQRIFVLMQEQLRHKKKFNLVAFNSKASAWKDRLVDVSERSLQNAWSWVQNLTCWGSTNTYGAIQLAMSDPNTEAIYLLTDGRPDQPPKSIIAQVQMQKCIPVHTISFNCQDRQANEFLYNLADATSGRFHYYSDDGPPVDQPDAWESMDIKLLKDEMKRGLENLDKLAGLRDECISMAWKKETDELRRSITSSREFKSISDSRDGARQLPSRPSSAGSRPSSAPPPLSPRSQSQISPRYAPSPPGTHSPTFTSGMPQRSRSARVSISRKPLVASHTKTSLMRTLNSSGRFSPNEWLLPETKKLFQLQAERQKNLADYGEKQEKLRTKRKKVLVKANKMSSKQWLSRHGLAAKKLTILDALGSTFIPHKAKYVSILDKHVMSKVFDDILPIAHVARDQQVNLVNPNGVNLREYESKVKVMVQKYTRRLNKIVWEALPESKKAEFGSNIPVSYEDNRFKLRNMLEETDWPVKEGDIKLMVDEIGRAEKFLRQSESLRKAAAGEADDNDENDDAEKNDDGDNDDDDDDEPPASSRSQKSEKSEKYQRALRHDSRSDGEEDGDREKDDNDDDDAVSEKSIRSEISRKSDHSHHSHPPPVSEKSFRSDRPVSAKSPRGGSNKPRPEDFEGLGQVIKSTDKSSRGKVKESSEVIRKKVRVKLDTLKGQKVVARLDQDGLYYPAVVLKCSDPRHAFVKYDSGSEAEVLTRNIIPTGGAVARPKLMVGDYVLMRVVNLDSNDECYVPAIVQVGPQSQQAQVRFFTVLMYNGQKASTLRTYLVKISKERFELASMYIAEQQNENRKEVEDLVYVTPRDKKVRNGKREITTIYEKNECDSQEKDSDENEELDERSSGHKSRTSIEIIQDKTVVTTTSVKKQQKKKKLKKKMKKEKKEDTFFDDSRSESESDVKEEISYQSDDDGDKEEELYVKTASGEDNKGDKSSEKRSHSSDKGMYSDDDDDDDVKSRSGSSYVKSRGSDSNDETSHRDGDASKRSDVSFNSKRKELEKLQRELQEREERQERQKRKLKKKARKLARLENDRKGSNLEGGDLENALGIPVANNESGGIEDQSSMYKLLQLRKSLHHLRPGEEVLARWSDDGWYYRGMVKHYHGDYSYNLEDSTGFVERIWREDIISENDNVNHVIELDTKVVALHPDFSFSYAPATVTFISDGEMSVRFYDESEATLPWNEVYPSTPEKHDIDAGYINKQEKRLIGASVVARDDKTGAYYPGSVTKRADDGIDYAIAWTDGSRSSQKSIHIFSAFTRRPPLSTGDRVLALADDVYAKFLPGYIVGSNSKDELIIKFCDGETCENVDPMLCYWLGQRFYDDAVKYYKTHDPSFY